MVSRKNLYLLLGDDWVSKQRKISWLKREVANSPSDFNIDTFYADEVSPDALKDALYTLTLKDNTRFLIIKRAEKLSSQNKKLILDFLTKPNPNVLLILDTENVTTENEPFLKEISNQATVLKLRRFRREENVFDLCRAVYQKNANLALRILSKLLVSGEKPLKILGGMVWFWTNKDIAQNKNIFYRDIDLLLKTDTNIKTGRIEPSLALEFLVVKLVSG